MASEEETVERAGNRCEECGVELTAAELEVALERGGPVLCAIHAAEVVEVDDSEGGPAPPGAA